MKTLIKNFFYLILVVFPLVSQSHMIDYIAEQSLLAKQHAEDISLPNPESRPVPVASLPKKLLSKEEAKNLLTRLTNGTIAAALSYGIFTALTKYASHLPFEHIDPSTALLMPFLIGAFENPEERYSSLQAAALGLAYTTTASLPNKTTMTILGALIALWAGSAIYKETKKLNRNT